MRNQAVHWTEGMFLRPQHFQAADRYWAELTQLSERFDHSYNYGLQSFDFSREALENQQFQVHLLQARMIDGTLVSLDTGQEPDRVSVKDASFDVQHLLSELDEAFATEPVVRVYFGVPKLRMGRKNVGTGEDGESSRYVENIQIVQDESGGGNDQEIQQRTLSGRLLLSTHDLSGYDLLPIAQIKRAGEGGAKPHLDDDYFPPVISLDAWPPLGRDIVRAIYDVIGQKIEVLSEQIRDRGIGLDSRDPGDTERILMLAQLNTAYATLTVLSFSQGVHPLTAYRELCRIAGQLSIFGPERRVGDLPPYDHEDLARIFRHVRDVILGLIDSVREYEYEQRYFAGVGMGMQVTMEPRWFNSDWQWFIGVHKGELTATECRDLLSSGQLDWKLGSSRQVEILFKHRAQGLQLAPVDRPPRAMPVRPEWLYFEVTRDDSPAWQDVQETQTLALRLKDSLIMNLDRLQGERVMVVSGQGRNVPLQFALFAVPLKP